MPIIDIHRLQSSSSLLKTISETFSISKFPFNWDINANKVNQGTERRNLLSHHFITSCAPSTQLSLTRSLFEFQRNAMTYRQRYRCQMPFAKWCCRSELLLFQRMPNRSMCWLQRHEKNEGKHEKRCCHWADCVGESRKTLWAFTMLIYLLI